MDDLTQLAALLNDIDESPAALARVSGAARSYFLAFSAVNLYMSVTNGRHQRWATEMLDDCVTRRLIGRDQFEQRQFDKLAIDYSRPEFGRDGYLKTVVVNGSPIEMLITDATGRSRDRLSSGYFYAAAGERPLSLVLLSEEIIADPTKQLGERFVRSRAGLSRSGHRFTTTRGDVLSVAHAPKVVNSGGAEIVVVNQTRVSDAEPPLCADVGEIQMVDIVSVGGRIWGSFAPR